MKLGVITTGALGWKSIGQRWQKHLPARVKGDTFFLEIQDFEGWEARAPYVSRHAWLRALLRGRRAAKAAIAMGADRILLCTIIDAPLVPVGPKYLIYGDATPRQLDELYYNDESDAPRKRFVRKRLSRIAARGETFLCMSEWYRQGVISEYGAKQSQTVLLPPFLDTDLWTPPENRSYDKPLRALFIGGDFERKGGDIILKLAPHFSPDDLEWDVVTSQAVPAPAHVRFHTGLGPDDPRLIALAQECHLFVFPTRADCSPNAVLEAAATGLPAIATNVGGISDMVLTGENGVLVEGANSEVFAQAINGYLAAPGKLHAEGESARERVVQRNSIEAHLQVLTSAING
jgi:glycosyltransferase involved in cell wall biosynthesis